MRDGSNQLSIRPIPPGAPAFLPALHLALGCSSLRSSEGVAPPVAALLAQSERGMVAIDLLLGAFDDEHLVSATLAAESPGSSALVFVPTDLVPAGRYQATLGLLEAVQAAAERRKLRLLQVLTAPTARTAAQALRESGFRFLTRLLYLRREVNAAVPARRGASDLEWLTYTPEMAELFAGALAQTYAQSLDCPELTGLRSMEDVLAGHRGAGEFDPAFWWVAKRDGEPVGTMLLNRISSEPAMEVVYMGVAQVARGTGVGDALLARAMAAASDSNVSSVALAVDERNAPARRMYARWGFNDIGARDAWIATPGATRG